MPPAPERIGFSYAPRPLPIEAWLGSRYPVENYGDGRRGFLGNGVQQKPLPIGRDHVLLPRIGLDRWADPSVEEGQRVERFNALAIRCCLDRDRHQSTIEGDIKQFPPVAAPTGHATAV